MKLDFYTPKSDILKKYIEGYYFITKDQNLDTIKYLTFPNNYCILSVSCNSKVVFEENRIMISPSSQNKTTANLVFRYNYPIEINYEKPIDEITIYFKPLGLNYFVNTLNVFSNKINIVNYHPFPDFREKTEEIFKINIREQQIELFENYWISKLKNIDLSLMEQISLDLEADLKIDEIAEKYNFSRQYINKLFLKNLGKTPSEYRKIHRFRTTLITQKKSKNLTDLSHGSFFFDQSHFIKDFKELTTIKPNQFFKKVDTDKENIWLFI